MTLLIDAGNSRVKWAHAEGGRVTGVRSLGMDEARADAFAPLFAEPPPGDGAAYVCNVAGADTAELLDRTAAANGIQCRYLASPSAEAGLVNAYADPTGLGADRWAALLGARAAAPDTAVVIVDAGTACTIDALAADGRHRGGMILPGLELMRQTLTERASGIAVDADTLRDPADAGDFFAGDTSHAVQNGSLAAVIGAIRYAMDALAETTARLIVTGGDAAAILRYLPDNTEHRPALVLEGLLVHARHGERA